jgi:hypothetical protein
VFDDLVFRERLENLAVDAPPGWVGRAPGQPIVRLGQPQPPLAELAESIHEVCGVEPKTIKLPALFEDGLELPANSNAHRVSAHACNRETLVLADPPVTDDPISLAEWVRWELSFEREKAVHLQDPGHLAEQCRRLIECILAWLRSKKKPRSPSWLQRPPNHPADRLQFWLHWLDGLNVGLHDDTKESAQNAATPDTAHNGPDEQSTESLSPYERAIGVLASDPTRKWTKKELAARVGVTRQTLYKAGKGKEIFEAFWALLNCPEDPLRGYKDAESGRVEAAVR